VVENLPVLSRNVKQIIFAGYRIFLARTNVVDTNKCRIQSRYIVSDFMVIWRRRSFAYIKADGIQEKVFIYGVEKGRPPGCSRGGIDYSLCIGVD
jgi:hypothetical protein